MPTLTPTRTPKKQPAARAKRKAPRPAITDIPLRVNLMKRGTISTTQKEWAAMPGIWTVETDFHSTGQITNGPEATVAEIPNGAHATCCNGGFHYSLDHERAKLLAQVFAGSPRLLKAAKLAIEDCRKEKLQHAHGALNELAAAVEAIESGALVFKP